MVGGDQLQQQFKDQMLDAGYSGAGYESLASDAYGQLANQPGYSAEDATAIKGDPNSAFQYYDPKAVNDIASQEAGGLKDATDSQGAMNGATEDEYGNRSGDIEGQYSGANSGIQNEYAGNLNTDLNKADLTVSPAEMQSIRDVASQTTAGQYTKMQDQAKLRAAAQGNTSPAALAAIEENLGREGAIQAGNAASAAEIGANQAKLSAEQSYSGMKTAADTNLANLKTSTAANEANLQATNNTTAAGLKSSNANTLAANRLAGAATAGTARTGAAEYGQSTGQNLAQTADQAASTRAATTANATIAGQQKGRDYLTGEQSLKQSAQSDAGNKQLSAYANEYSGANNATSIGSNNAIAGASNTTAMIGNIAGAASGALAAFADGGVITKPTVGIIGEHGPEQVVKLGGAQRRYRPPMAA